MQDLTQDEMFGIAKKISRELSEYPLHTHGALIQLVNIGFEHRKIAMQRADKERQDAENARVLKLREQEIGLLQAEQHRVDAQALTGPTLIKQ